MSYNSDIHHRHSVRLKDYDYSLEGLYFITVCAQDKKCLFGKITDGVIRLNEAGRMVESELMKTMQIRPNMIIHEHIIMPNHIHFIIQITHRRGGLNPPDDTNETNIINTMGNGQCGCIQGGFNPPLQHANTICSMVRGFKAAITKQIGHPIWQRSYYEHIIRNQHSYEEISDYIVTNPLRWEKDQLFAEQ
jgi:putative transposase